MTKSEYTCFRIRKKILDRIKEEKEKTDPPFVSISSFVDHLLREYLKHKES
jgi:hypothetical protein